MAAGVHVVWVALVVDLEAAIKAKREKMALDFMRQFQAQGEAWKKEAAADPLIASFLKVRVCEETSLTSQPTCAPKSGNA